MTPAEFAAYVEANYRHLLHFVRRHGPAGEEAPDLLQASLLRLWVNCERIEPGRADAYFFRALRNGIHDARARLASRPRFRGVEEASAPSPPGAPADRELEGWVVATLSQVKAGMPELQRLAFASCWRALGDRR